MTPEVQLPLEEPVSKAVEHKLKLQYSNTTEPQIKELVETFDIMLDGKTISPKTIIKDLRKKQIHGNINLKLMKKTTKTGKMIGFRETKDKTTDMELFYTDTDTDESVEDYFKRMIKNKETNATFVSVKVPANKIPGEMHTARVSDLSHSLMGKIGQAMGRNDSTQTGCGGKYIEFMIRKDMIPGENIILLCKAHNNLDSTGKNFIPLSDGFNFEQIKKYVEKLTISDIVDEGVRNAVELLARYIKENELEIDIQQRQLIQRLLQLQHLLHLQQLQQLFHLQHLLHLQQLQLLLHLLHLQQLQQLQHLQHILLQVYKQPLRTSTTADRFCLNPSVQVRKRAGDKK